MAENFEQYTNTDELQIIDIEEGDGNVVGEDATISAFYRLFLTNGKVVQSNFESGNTFTSPLSGLVKGWQQGLPGMREGGTRRLVVPSDLAYGESGAPGIPGGATLVFDVKVVRTR